MRRSHRFLLYVVGGGVLITWLQPPSGLLTLALVLGFIIASAYLDAWLFQDAAPAVALRSEAGGRTGARRGKGASGRRAGWEPVYATAEQDAIEPLLQSLRSEGLHPITLTQRQEGEDGSFIHVVRLPHEEVGRARPIVEMFELRTMRRPS